MLLFRKDVLKMENKDVFLTKYPIEIYGSTMLKVMLNDLFRMEMTQEDLKFLKDLNMVANDDFELYEDLTLNYIAQGTTDFFTENEISKNELQNYLTSDMEASIATGDKKANLEEQFDYVQNQIRAWTAKKHELEKEMEPDIYNKVQQKTPLVEKIEDYENDYVQDIKEEKERKKEQEMEEDKQTKEAREYLNKLLREGISESR